MPQSPLPSFNALIASARPILPERRLTPKYETWQDEVWAFYDALGEFEFGVSWLANMLSKVRLLAAELDPKTGEPVPIEDGPAAEAMARLAGGVGGQAQLMKEFTVHLSVPGECWLVGEEPDDITGTEEEIWSIKSADELRVSRRKIRGQATYEVRESDADSWRPIAPESLVVRCWNSHPRWGWRADSSARHALGALFELDSVNKRIIATVLSRLASNGFLLYDKTRLSIPPRMNPDGSGPSEVDPFAQMLVEVASRGIKDPASPEATIPIPIGFQVDDLTNVDPKMLMQWIQLSDGVDDAVLKQRESAIRRLATSMDLPAEILLGMGDSNHWSAWQIEESGIKAHVTPLAELISHCLTVGYLKPMLTAAGAQLTGPNGGKIVVWYDPSEIVVRPDKSGNVLQAYDRLEVSGTTLRREIGVDEDDAPDKKELSDMMLKQLVRLVPALAASAAESLGAPKLEQVTPKQSSTITIGKPGSPTQPVEAPADGPPDQPAEQAPAPEPVPAQAATAGVGRG